MSKISQEDVYSWLDNVSDPEVPVLTVLDMGIIRGVQLSESNGEVTATITITPTYSGCPAMDVIGMNIRMALLSRGINHVIIEQQLSPAWTTDWMSEDGKRKLKEYGIAPPQHAVAASKKKLFSKEQVPCLVANRRIQNW